MLGTLVEMAIPTDVDDEFRRLTDAAFACIAVFHEAMSFHSPDSDLAAIARCRTGEHLRVAPETWRTLALSLAFEAETAGLFNVAIAPALVARGLLPTPPRAEPPIADSARSALRLLPDNRVQVMQPVWIDLGGIAKGAAVDAAVDALQRAGVVAGLVNAGGDLRAFGDFEHTIHTRHPNDPAALLPIAQLRDGAFATSSNQFCRSAVVAPKGHSPWGSGADISVSVAAPTCAVADALTKIVSLAGPAARESLNLHGAHALWVDHRGEIRHV